MCEIKSKRSVTLILTVVSESFHIDMHDILYFLPDGDIWTTVSQTVLFIWLCHVCFLGLKIKTQLYSDL